MKTLTCKAVSGLPCDHTVRDVDEGKVRHGFWAHVERQHPDLAFGMGDRRNQEWQQRIDSLLRDDAPSTRGGRHAPGSTPPTTLPPTPPDPRPDDGATTPKSLRRTR